MLKVEDYKLDSITFLYNDEIIKTVTNPPSTPSEDDEVIVNGFRFRVLSLLFDYDDTKIFVFLGESVTK